MYKNNLLAILFLSAPSVADTFSIVPDIKNGLPAVMNEPVLYQAPQFDYFNLADSYLEQRAEAIAKLPMALSDIERVCIQTSYSGIDPSSSDQSGVLVYTYAEDNSGIKIHNTTIGDRVNLETVSKHCIDESNWVYDNWLADKSMTFTPYSSSSAVITDVRVIIDGSLSLSQVPAEFTEQYYDFIAKVGFDQSANFYHPDGISGLKDVLVSGLEQNNSSMKFIKNMAFGNTLSKEDIVLMSDLDFMNQFLSILGQASGSNTANLESFKVINVFDYNDKKYINVEKQERLFGKQITRNEVVILKKYGDRWLLELPEILKEILDN
ncbi:hypothetical protein GTG28_12610 [Vibrio sp. OCN044]|uniref:DUF3828 domain-containing protein n=1 Tax=Vibrio tetraodonis subsp. pristinus TaxID=2695891 RepID=A0A6L8LVF1_9VIBR|nr:hypothetical protein [Vibrio tetraodonis]MYM60067.1 hypothetical protein [Vibrio tetraodonis subsp. pristinus]